MGDFLLRPNKIITTDLGKFFKGWGKGKHLICGNSFGKQIKGGILKKCHQIAYQNSKNHKYLESSLLIRLLEWVVVSKLSSCLKTSQSSLGKIEESPAVGICYIMVCNKYTQDQ